MTDPIDLGRPAPAVAPDLLGAELLVDDPIHGELRARIVEVEAYEPDDPASHSFRGPTPRTTVMFGPPGHLYVYRSYGIHWCANIVTGEEGVGRAVLVRAVEPLAGAEAMAERRGRPVGSPLVTNGPGKLCQALGITGDDDGVDLHTGRIRLVAPARPVVDIVAGPRIGITKAVERPWRFGDAGSRHLSRPFPPPAQRSSVAGRGWAAVSEQR